MFMLEVNWCDSKMGRWIFTVLRECFNSG